MRIITIYVGSFKCIINFFLKKIVPFWNVSLLGDKDLGIKSKENVNMTTFLKTNIKLVNFSQKIALKRKMD